ncbi:hypothetical protein AB5N19_13156 [Seiridium cardinale]|uniref:Uncharacterized protein n=1 Tax=Seiridium cardinale TaxID=138064 RepID=A0ABR2XEQ9_9PEZI
MKITTVILALAAAVLAHPTPVVARDSAMPVKSPGTKIALASDTKEPLVRPFPPDRHDTDDHIKVHGSEQLLKEKLKLIGHLESTSEQYWNGPRFDSKQAAVKSENQDPST